MAAQSQRFLKLQKHAIYFETTKVIQESAPLGVKQWSGTLALREPESEDSLFGGLSVVKQMSIILKSNFHHRK
jgi:hypothetical protein